MVPATSWACDGPYNSVTSPQQGQRKNDMFSIRPRIGMCSCWAMEAALRTTIPARPCGVVTRTMPLSGTDCITVSEASDVPGGRSMIR